MKKIVPDPPTLKLVDTLHPAIHSDLIPPDALAIASDLLLGISEVIDTHCRANAGEKGMKMLTNARHSADIAHALIEHALVRL